ncbi:MAG TPA: hypothetical protein VNK49_08880 [Anaerolineales bacterium]|nr:hypothetical protein [Anaerolineales bacterium]
MSFKFNIFFLGTALAVMSVASVFILRDVDDLAQTAPEPVIGRPESAPAMTALIAMYAPAADKENWMALVCAGMTEGGCTYFKTHFADDLWTAQSNNDASGAVLSDEAAAVIDDNTRVWKARLTVFDGGVEVGSDVFLLVRRGMDGWYLDRVLYAPGISLQED